MQYTKITYPFYVVLSKCHILFMHEWRVNSNKQIYENQPIWKFWKFVIHGIKPRVNQSSQKLIYLKYFERLSIFLWAQNYLVLETIHNEKKAVKKTKATTNTLFPFCPGSIILESLFLNTCYLGLKTVNKQVILIFLWLKVLVESRFSNQSVPSYLKILKLSNWH